MTVHFIGAGPGAADLLTLRGRDLIARCPVCLYAGSLVPVGVLQHCPPNARIVDTAPLSLENLRARDKDVLTRSARVEELLGVGSVAEAAALAGAGSGSILLAPRDATTRLACAIARAKDGGESP